MIKSLVKFFKAVGGAVCSRRTAAMLLALTTAAVVLTSAASVNTVTVSDGERVVTVKTFSRDAAAILGLAGIDFDAENDSISAENLGKSQSSVTLSRAFEVFITYGNDRYTVKVCGGTVEDVIAKAGIAVDEHDIISADLNDTVSAGMYIDIISVDYSFGTAEEEIAPGVDTVYSDDMYVGESVTTEGQAGVKLVTYQTKIVDGVETETAAVSEEILSQPVNAIMTVGTKQKAVATAGVEYSGSTGTGNAAGAKSYSGVNSVSSLQPGYDFELDENNRPVNYSKLIKGRATAYYGGGRTATGKTVQTGYVAVNPKQIPYGTKLYIITSDGSMIYGYASAEDTGGFAKYGKTTIDLYFNTYGECVNFGARQVEIYVLD